MFDLPQMLKERAALQTRLSSLNKLIQAAADYQASASFPANPPPLPETRKAPSERPMAGRAAPVMGATESAVTELLEQRGGPVPLSDIITHLFDSGVPLPTKHTNNVVSARLSNSPKFVGRRGIGWWFADRAWPGDTELALNAPDEIEAPNGGAAGASETARAAQ
jgi:hypothetical protein